MEDRIVQRRALSLPAVLTLAAVMALLEYFFIVSLNSGETRIAAWIVAAGLLTLFVLILGSANFARYRRIFFVASALLFFPSFIAVLIESRGAMFLDTRQIFLNETPMCPIVIPLVIVPWAVNGTLVFPARLTNHFASVYAMLSIWLVGTLTIGRGWCSWVCFYGGWDDGASRVLAKPRLALRDGNKRIRYFNFAVLAFCVLAGLATLTCVYCSWLCPFKLVTEYVKVADAASYLAMIMFVLLFFSLAIVLPLLTRRRVQCMSLCPFGAFQSLVGKASLYRVKIDADRCTSCGACAKACPVMAIDTTEKPRVLATCTLCGECVAACSRQALAYQFAWSRACGTPKSLAAGWLERLNARGITRGLRVGAARFLLDVFSPRALMSTTAFTIGMIICGSFTVGTVARVIHLFTTGSFLLQ